MMRNAVIWVVASLAAPAARLRAEDAWEHMRQVIEAAAQTQRTATLATTTAAIAAQKASVRKQIQNAGAAPGSLEPDAYFTLPLFPPPEAPLSPELVTPEPPQPATAPRSPVVVRAATTANPSAGTPAGVAQKRPLPADKP